MPGVSVDLNSDQDLREGEVDLRHYNSGFQDTEILVPRREISALHHRRRFGFENGSHVPETRIADGDGLTERGEAAASPRSVMSDEGIEASQGRPPRMKCIVEREAGAPAVDDGMHVEEGEVDRCDVDPMHPRRGEVEVPMMNDQPLRFLTPSGCTDLHRSWLERTKPVECRRGAV